MVQFRTQNVSSGDDDKEARLPLLDSYDAAEIRPLLDQPAPSERRRIRADHHALALRPTHADPARLVLTVVEEAMPLARALDIVLTTGLATDLPLVEVDVDRFGQVLTNLLDNAFKYTRRGGHVHVAVVHSADAVLVSVRDTGIGIAKENLPRVFDRYWQERPSAYPGYGIGLSVAKLIIEASGGHIWVTQSELGRGTTVSFTLPAVDDVFPEE